MANKTKTNTSNGFKIISPNTLACKFHLISNALRHEASSYGLISGQFCLPDDETNPLRIQRAERAAVFPLMQLLERFDRVKERVDEIGDALDDSFSALVNALNEQQAQVVGLAKKALDASSLPWELIPHAFVKGEEIVVKTDDASHGAEVVRIHRQDSIFGSYMAVNYRFFSYDGRRFRWAHATKNIPAYDGDKGAEQIGLLPMSSEFSASLESMGRQFAKFCTEPSYLHYDGILTRRSWRGDKRFRASGRSMIDLRSMKEMDPGYDEFYGSFDDDDNGVVDAKDQQFDAKQLRLSSPYVYGFSFLSKSWGEMLVSGLRPIEFRKAAFDQLVLDADRKRLIEALVRQNSGSFSDLIEGKGGGCIFLLHGQPGVGKTLTAEAIAERLERPLYMVGAGELGITPDELEDRLKSVLDTAHAWNAVLLIDEADIFLERRAQNDVARNAMVGIFLRLLEYHQGILFLTTNRVADIDEAFLSRVSVGLHYAALKESDRESIWRNLLASTQAFDMSLVDCKELSRLEINGRQIKHCIRLALALAQSDSRPATGEDLFDMAQMAMAFKKDFQSACESDANK